jgi:hypothetical protein
MKTNLQQEKSWTYHYLMARFGRLKGDHDSVFGHGIQCNKILRQSYKKENVDPTFLKKYYKTYLLLKEVNEQRGCLNCAEQFFLYCFFSIQEFQQDTNYSLEVRTAARDQLIAMHAHICRFYLCHELIAKRNFFVKKYPINKLKFLLIQ